jgi:hypothetical protein
MEGRIALYQSEMLKDRDAYRAEIERLNEVCRRHIGFASVLCLSPSTRIGDWDAAGAESAARPHRGPAVVCERCVVLALRCVVVRWRRCVLSRRVVVCLSTDLHVCLVPGAAVRITPDSGLVESLQAQLYAANAQLASMRSALQSRDSASFSGAQQSELSVCLNPRPPPPPPHTPREPTCPCLLPSRPPALLTSFSAPSCSCRRCLSIAPRLLIRVPSRLTRGCVCTNLHR